MGVIPPKLRDYILYPHNSDIYALYSNKKDIYACVAAMVSHRALRATKGLELAAPRGEVMCEDLVIT